MNRMKNQASIISWNSTIFLLLIIIVEITLGEWLTSTPPVADVPDSIWNKKLVFDVSQLYNETKPIYTEYTRDKKGYRGLLNTENRPVLLTIGGSTTDQRYVSDNDTWQEVLNRGLSGAFKVLNGGIDGQTSFGHLFSVKVWHSKELDSKSVSAVLFYIGINDVRLLERGQEGLTRYDLSYQTANPLQKAKITLAKNSFFYKKIKNIREKFYAQQGSTYQGIVWAGHRRPIEHFKDPGILFNINSPQHYAGFEYYSSLVKELAEETYKAFPNAKILFVQQPVPGCNFVSEREVFDRHPDKLTETVPRQSLCTILGQVYLTQKIAIASLESPHTSIVQMYLNNVITDNGVYDSVHTNPSGSRDIGNWLTPILRKEFQLQ